MDGLHERYVNFYTDFAFKKLFGTEVNKSLLKSFLNALLQRPAVLREKVFNRLFESAEIAKFNPQERLDYEQSLKVYRDISALWKRLN